MSPTLKRIIIIFTVAIVMIPLVFLVLFLKKKTPEKTARPNVINPPSSNFQPISQEKKIRDTFEASLKTDPSAEEKTTVKTIQFTDEAGVAADINTVSTSLNFNLDPPIREYLYQKDYAFYTCQKSASQVFYGLGLNIGLPEGQTQDKSEQLMRHWEENLLKDLHSILFPKILFTEEKLKQPLVFKDGQTRYAEINLPDGSKSSINYTILLQSINISTSPECIFENASVNYNP